MRKYSRIGFFVFVCLGAWVHTAQADMDVKLTTNDGSSKFSIQNSAAAEIASVDSLGNAVFARATIGGTIIAGTGVNQITTAAGLVDAAKLTGNLPSLNGSALTNLTGANVTGNISGNAASLTGAINSNQINAGSLPATVIASSIALGAVQDTSIVSVSASKLTGLVPDASINASSVTKQGNTFNAAGQLVRLDSSGNMTLPSGASITVGILHGTIVPSGTLILTTSTCPSGFTEYTAARGYYLVGVPSGGSVGGTVGSAMGDLSNANHNHTVTTATANFVNTLGSAAAVTSVTSPTGDVARGTIAPYFQIRLCSVP